LLTILASFCLIPPFLLFFSVACSCLLAEASEVVHAKDQVWGLIGSGVVIAYAMFVLAGEPAHEAAHPYYQAPYAFVKRNMENGAQWWPGRHCQLFEFNCFEAAYREADELLRAKEKEAYTK